MGKLRNNKSDMDLITDTLNGNHESFTMLVNRYYASLYWVIYRIVGNSTDADDLTSESLVKAYEKLSSYSNKYAFSTWLFKIASNNCIDFIRKKKNITVSLNDVQYNEEGGELTMEIKSLDRDPEEEFIRDQKLELLREVVSKLKPHYRTLVEMRYFDEFSYEEIATELQLPLGTVKAKLFRARDLLFNMLSSSRDMM